MPESAPRPFRVISYNVLVGYRDHRVGKPYHPGAVRKRNILAFLAAEQPDIVAFQELNGYTADRLRADAETWGHRFAVMLKQRGYPTGLTSRYPIEVVERKIEGMHHGLMRVRTAGIDCVVVHLWPFKGEQRRREIEPALAMYRAARAEGRPTLMLGDFNAVARADLPLFDATADARYRAWRWERDAADRPRTDVIDACLAAGLVDVWAQHRGAFGPMRLPRVDFVLASPDLAQRCRAARWIADPAALANSDHPAVVADFDWPVPAPAAGR